MAFSLQQAMDDFFNNSGGGGIRYGGTGVSGGYGSIAGGSGKGSGKAPSTSGTASGGKAPPQGTIKNPYPPSSDHDAAVAPIWNDKAAVHVKFPADAHHPKDSCAVYSPGGQLFYEQITYDGVGYCGGSFYSRDYGYWARLPDCP